MLDSFQKIFDSFWSVDPLFENIKIVIKTELDYQTKINAVYKEKLEQLLKTVEEEYELYKSELKALSEVRNKRSQEKRFENSLHTKFKADLIKLSEMSVYYMYIEPIKTQVENLENKLSNIFKDI